MYAKSYLLILSITIEEIKYVIGSYTREPKNSMHTFLTFEFSYDYYVIKLRKYVIFIIYQAIEHFIIPQPKFLGLPSFVIKHSFPALYI